MEAGPVNAFGYPAPNSRSSWFVSFALIALSALVCSVPSRAEESPASRVVLVANQNDLESIRLAQYYAEKRGVPADNIIALPMSLEETITWSEFVATIWQPLQDELLRRKWIDAIPMSSMDSVGRRKLSPNGHRIAFLVTCRGVPLRIEHDPSRQAEVRPFTSRPEFRTNRGAVDSELALLATVPPPINAFVPNVLFRNDRPGIFDHRHVVKVSRLDAPTYEHARALVDDAIRVEQRGLAGRAYVDLGGIHADGDRWLESVVTQLDTLGFDTDVDRDPATLTVSARIDAPALYFGWYAPDVNGPFALPGFRFSPGAIAVHIHSHSARTLRSGSEGWAGPLVARGATATVGNVFEPYLQMTHAPDLLLRALARGAMLGDAAFYALPTLSWQGIVIGDPLYRPFAVPLEVRVSMPGVRAPFREYALVRRARWLEARGQAGESLESLRREMAERPNVVIGLELARRLEVLGDSAGARGALVAASASGIVGSAEWSVVRHLAERLEACGAEAEAVMVYQMLLANEKLPRELRTACLRAAHRVAAASGNLALADGWARELEQLAVAPAERD